MQKYQDLNPLPQGFGHSCPKPAKHPMFDCLRGLGIDRKPRKKTVRRKKHRKLSKEERERAWLERIRRKVESGEWVERKDFFRVHDVYLSSPEWESKRQMIIQRCASICEHCFERPPYLHIHHLTYGNWRHEPLEDLIALCPKCHKEIHS